MRSIQNILVLLVLVLVSVSAMCLGYSGGDGTIGNPYQIATKADLLSLGATPSDYGKCFILTADIDLSGETFTQAVIAPDMDNATSDFQGTEFTGVFNGDGHVIRNLTIAASDRNHIGLFGRVGSNGQIRKLGVEDVNCTGSYSVGGLVGENRSGSITSCYTTGVVSCEKKYATVGGLVGTNYQGTINTCYTTCTVSSESDSSSVGGFVGWNYKGSITNCYATGEVFGEGESSIDIGGLVGWNMGTITASYATGAVDSVANNNSSLAGLVGCNDEDGIITFCYSTGAIGGVSNYIGGLVGYNSAVVKGEECSTSYLGVTTEICNPWILKGTIKSCYATGVVNAKGKYVGGLVGYNGVVNGEKCTRKYNYSGNLISETCQPYTSGGVIDSSFWDKQSSRRSSSDGGESKTTNQMQIQATFTEAEWDFLATDGDPADWQMPILGGYPILAWQAQQSILTVVANPATGGTFTGGGIFALDSQQTITATANAGWIFTGWSDGNMNPSRIVTVLLGGATYTANFQQQSDTFTITSMSVKAGKRTPNSPADSFAIVGTSFDLDASAVPTQADTIEFTFFNRGDTEPCFEGTLPFVPQQFKQGKYAGKDAHYTFSFDVSKHTFSLSGKLVYLCGLGSSLHLEITIGDVLLSGLALDNEAVASGGEVDVINGKNRMPLELMMGDTDTLRVDKYTIKPGKGGVDSLTASGMMTVADPNVNLAQQEVSIQWGDVEVVIPAGSFVRVGSMNKFVYTRPKGSTTLPDATITLDWETGRFTMAIKAPGLASQPRTLNVRFLDYNESDAVN